MPPPPLTPGKARGLATTSTDGGIFTILAVDHRDSLRIVIDPERPDRISAAEMTSLKLDLIAGLGTQASAVMVEPEYSAGQAIVSHTLAGSVGFLAAIEAQGYLGDPTARQTTLLEDWGVEKAKRLGAGGIKLLVLYRPDAGAVTDQQDELISAVVAECRRHDVALFLEPLAYPLEPGSTTDTDDFASTRRAIVIETVERLGALGPDVLKVQFPVDTRRVPDRGVWADACAELDEASPVPWALLSGGDPYELFRDQVRVACDAGASGFMVGRALWGVYVRSAAADRQRLMDNLLRDRFGELSVIATEHGTDWRTRHTMVEVDENWYRTY